MTKLGVVRASAARTVKTRLSSGIAALDDFLGGGLPIGVVTEWGMPLGFGARRVALQFLAGAARASAPAAPLPSLWIYPATRLYAFPPAWAACGVDLTSVGFVRSDEPVRDLKPALVDPYYKIIVLDMPANLSKDDLAFLARQARAQRRVVMLLRNGLLREERGNVWAPLRLNCRRAPQRGIELEVVRGLPPRRVVVDLERGRR